MCVVFEIEATHYRDIIKANARPSITHNRANNARVVNVQVVN